MAWCIMAPSHYPKQFWLITNEACWQLAKSNFTESVPDTTDYKVFEKIDLARNGVSGVQIKF